MPSSVLYTQAINRIFGVHAAIRACSNVHFELLNVNAHVGISRIRGRLVPEYVFLFKPYFRIVPCSN